MNRHANNAAFVAWCLESVPAEIWQEKRLTDMEISYQSESFYGEVLTSTTSKVQESTGEGNTMVLVHTVTNADAKTLATMCTIWEC